MRKTGKRKAKPNPFVKSRVGSGFKPVKKKK